MTLIEILINTISIISAGIAIWQAYSARKDRKEIEKYKDLIKSKIVGQEIISIHEEALKTKQIIVKYSSSESINHGKNLESDKEKILSFVSRINENKSLFQKDVGSEYFNSMKKAITENDYLTMLLMTSDLLGILKDEKNRYLY